MGRGGWRSFLQPVQRWIGITSSLATRSHHQPLSWAMGGLMREGFWATAASPPSLAGFCSWAGLNFSTRKLIQPRGSPSWSVKVVRVVMKYPMPAPVAFSSEISAITVSAVTTSPSLT